MKKNIKLRVAHILLNAFLYVMFIGVFTFVVVNGKGLEDYGGLSMWVLMLLMLLAVSVFVSYRIWTWIKEGKI